MSATSVVPSGAVPVVVVVVVSVDDVVVDVFFEPFADAVVVSAADLPPFAFDPAPDFVLAFFAVAPDAGVVFLDPPADEAFAGFGGEAFGAAA